MKKLIAILIALFTVLTLVSCVDNDQTENNDDVNASFPEYSTETPATEGNIPEPESDQVLHTNSDGEIELPIDTFRPMS